MENVEKNEQELQDTLLSELKSFNVKINIAIVLIILILIAVPSVLMLKIFGVLGGLITFLLIVGLVIGLIFSLRMYNHTKIICKTHVWLLDCLINDKNPFI